MAVDSGTASSRQDFAAIANQLRMPTGPVWAQAVREHNWLAYALTPRPGKKLSKIPLAPGTGRAADAKDAARLTLAEALADGHVGYLARPGSVMIAADLDACLAPGCDVPDPWAAALIAPCPSWVERSPSGTGIRCLLARSLSRAPEIVTERNNVGLYASDSRFFSVTFDWLSGRVVGSDPDLVEAVLARINGGPAPPRSDAPASAEHHWFPRLSEKRQDQEVERMLSLLTDESYGREYDLWLKLSFATYRATDSTGYEVWDRWCQGLPGYDAATNRKKWESGFRDRPSGMRVTVATLIMHAQQHGYQRPPDAMPRLRYPAIVGVTTRLRRLGRTSRR